MPETRAEATFSTDPCTGAIWIVDGARINERLNEPFLVELDVRTDLLDLDLPSLLGTDGALVVRRGENEQRYLGVITGLVEGNPSQHEKSARLRLEPAFAALAQRRNTRIFQDMTVPEILKAVLSEGLGAWGRGLLPLLTSGYPKREYCVQYQESDLDFVSRLMEEEGIVYSFDHAEEKETFVLLDSPSHFDTIVGPTDLGFIVGPTDLDDIVGPTDLDDIVGPTDLEGVLLFVGREDDGDLGAERVRAFHPRSALQPTRVAYRAFDWTHPSVPIEASSPPEDPEHGDGASVGAERESYEHDAPLTLHTYRGDAYLAHDAERQRDLRRELQERDAILYEGRTTVLGSRPAKRFNLLEHPNFELNAEYVLVTSTHFFGEWAEEESPEGTCYRYFNRIEAIRSEKMWRPAKLHPKPRISGIQTALVVGPPGEEIHTDEHGRIKVHFHWDRLGAHDGEDSLWVRVAQSWAGPGWGMLFLPRIGMEVVVSFVNGDPDRPLVTSCVYNGDNRPPYELPAEKTKSTIKSNSSIGGGGYNELRFEDKAGAEEIFVHAQKDWNTVVENDVSTEIVRDEQRHIGRNRRTVIDSREFHRVGVSRSTTIGVNESHTVNHVRYVTVPPTSIEMARESESIILDTGAGAQIRMVGPDIFIEAEGEVYMCSKSQCTVQSSNAETVIRSPQKIRLRQGGA